MPSSVGSKNDYTVFANFLLSAGIVTLTAAKDYNPSVQFLQKIGFCLLDAQAIAHALMIAAAGSPRPPITPGHVPLPHRPGGPSPIPGGVLAVPPGWLVGSPRVQGGVLPLISPISAPLAARLP